MHLHLRHRGRVMAMEFDKEELRAEKHFPLNRGSAGHTLPSSTGFSYPTFMLVLAYLIY